MNTELEDFLEHHGIKGMRWGIRHQPVKVPSSSDSADVAGLRKKPVHSLSNQELRTLTQRQELERKFRQLNPTTVAKGHAHLKTVLATAGTVTSVIALANSPIGKTGLVTVKKFLAGPAGKHFIKP